MRCKGIDVGTGTVDTTCGGKKWELIWFSARMEGENPVNLWQCRTCKRIVMATDEYQQSDKWA